MLGVSKRRRDSDIRAESCELSVSPGDMILLIFLAKAGVEMGLGMFSRRDVATEAKGAFIPLIKFAGACSDGRTVCWDVACKEAS